MATAIYNPMRGVSGPLGRRIAALCFIVGALLSRFAWLEAGRISSREPNALIQIQSESASS
jgi:hypothetical protein